MTGNTIFLSVKTEIKLYLLLSIILLLDLVLYLFYRISFAGQVIDKVIFWLWFISTFYIVFKYIKTIWARVYGSVLTVLVGLNLIPLGIPFIGAVVFATSWAESHRVGDDLRVFDAVRGPFAGPYVSVAKNYWLLEKEIGDISFDFDVNGKYYSLKDVQSISLVEDSNTDDLFLRFEFEKDYVVKKVETSR